MKPIIFEHIRSEDLAKPLVFEHVRSEHAVTPMGFIFLADAVTPLVGQLLLKQLGWYGFLITHPT